MKVVTEASTSMEMSPAPATVMVSRSSPSISMSLSSPTAVTAMVSTPLIVKSAPAVVEETVRLPVSAVPET